MRFSTIAWQLARQPGRPVRYVDCTPADLLQCAEAAGIEAWQAQDMVTWQTEARERRHAVVHDSIERITERAPRRVETFALEMATSLRYANGPATGARRQGVSSQALTADIRAYTPTCFSTRSR